MPYIEFKGKQIEIDEDGYLKNLDDWTPELSEYMAQQDGLTLTEQHWEVINFLRDYYQKYQIAPMIKILVKEMAKMFGPEKGNTKYLYGLFQMVLQNKHVDTQGFQNQQDAYNLSN